MSVNQKLLIGFSREERRAICDGLKRDYAAHVKACAECGTDDEDRPIVPADSFSHFADEWIAVYRAERIEAPAPLDLTHARHSRRDYAEIYQAPLDVSLI